MTDRPTTFCPLPWNHLAVRPNGDVGFCCIAGSGTERGALYHQDGTRVNLGRDRIVDARNSNFPKGVRASMLRGERHPVCQRCWSEEDAGLTSRRINENDNWPDWKSLVDDTRDDGSISLAPAYFDLRFGNLCNLKCRMCGPNESSSWYGDYTALTGAAEFNDGSEIVKLTRQGNRLVEPTNRYEWYDDNARFWADLGANRESMRQVHFAGGEPLLIEAHYDFLDQCVTTGYSKNIILSYNTNLTKLRRRALDIWPHFKEVRIAVSIDAVGKVNDYIRHPSRWSILEKNLHRLQEASGDNARLTIAPTIGAYNILYLPDLIRWRVTSDLIRFNDYRVSQKALLSPHPIAEPEHVSFYIFPSEVKQAIAAKLREVIPWMEDKLADGPPRRQERMVSEGRRIIERYIELMFQKDLSNRLPNFWHYTRQIDRIRGENIETSLPELYDLIAHTEPR